MNPVMKSLFKSFGIDVDNPKAFFDGIGVNFDEVRALPSIIVQHLENYNKQLTEIQAQNAEILSLLKKENTDAG